MINAFPANQQEQTRMMLADSLKAVVAQQLLRTKDGKGRCAAVEILIGSSALSSMIREGKISQINSYIQTGTGQGMQTMDQHLLDFIKQDKITPQAAYEKAINKGLFTMLDEDPVT
jgi:twitching motility protein PilT